MSGSKKNGFAMFWKNYERVQEWCVSNNMIRFEHRLQALEMENALLHNYINSELQRKLYNTAQWHPGGSTEKNYEVDCAAKVPTDRMVQEADEDDDDVHISEELLAFYEQTIRHKIEHRKFLAEEKKKLVEDNEFKTEDDQRLCPLHLTELSQDMKFLYGNAAAKISSMELSMQINFDSNRVRSNASLWPNIPLRLSRNLCN